MLEARELVQECITKGEQSAATVEFCGMAPGVPLLPDGQGYRLYIECLFDELSTEVKVLFDRRDPASVLWPKRATLRALLDLLNAAELAKRVGRGRDHRLGLPVLQRPATSAEDARGEPGAAQQPRAGGAQPVLHAALRGAVPHRQHAGRIWYEMRGTETALKDRCEYMVRKPDESSRRGRRRTRAT
jgi:hypothetical protein